MKRNKQSPASGIRIENTISMAVQNRNHKRNPLHLLIIALCGGIGGIFTFLSMFKPLYDRPVLIALLLGEFTLCALMAARPQRWQPLKIGATLLYGILLYLLRTPFYNGFVFLVNTIYKVIYMTDWERFVVAEDASEIYCVTVFLALIFFPILCMLCYAVLRFQNFFLSLIATFPYVEIGFYFGVPANHIFAAMLLAFWFSMTAVHLSNLGSYHSTGQNSFLRRDNTFFPVSSMRFMVTEKIGIIVLCSVMIGCFLLQQTLQLLHYERSDEIKTIRSNVQDYLASVMLGGSEDSSELWKSLWVKRDTTGDRIVVPLGVESKREFQNIPVSGVTFSDIPEDRLYLKYCTGEIYSENSWRMPDETVYGENTVFSLFERLDYYPPEFLYEAFAVTDAETISMRMNNVKGFVGECIPYGFKPDDAIGILRDNRFTAFPKSYDFLRMQDYESMFLASSYNQIGTGAWYEHCRPENQKLFEMLFDYAQAPILRITVPMNYPSSIPENQAMESYLLSSYGYKAYVESMDLQVPDTPAMDHVRSVYQPLLNQYQAESASPADTIAFLQDLRTALSEDMTYTLAPGRTPSDKDFVEHFLLENRRGYCMHYATAGVMLARMAGIPARYCEGYMLDFNTLPLEKTATNEYTTDILDNNAHAWAEIYIEGWGWIPFEFTFSQSEPPIVTEPATQASIVAPTQPTTFSTYAPTVTTDTEVVPSQPQDEQKKSPIPMIIVWVACVSLCIGAVLALIGSLRSLALTKRRKQFTQADRNKAAKCIYRYLLRLLAHCGVPTNVQKTADIIQEGTALCGKYFKAYSLEGAVAIAAKAEFSPHVITEQELKYLQNTAEELANAMYRDASIPKKLKLRYVLHFV